MGHLPCPYSIWVVHQWFASRGTAGKISAPVQMRHLPCPYSIWVVHQQGKFLPQSRWDICPAPTAFGWFTSGSPVGARQGNILPQSRWDTCRALTAFGWFTSRGTAGKISAPVQMGHLPCPYSIWVVHQQGKFLPQSRCDICPAPTAFGWFTSGSPVGARQGKFLPQSRCDICRAPTAFGWFTSRENFCPSPDATSALPLQHLGGSPVVRQ
ncbi:hypothetical protein MiSe_27100 [Microseira wollei NIES-4236]|uniref:Uncharacterized protein n=1 Tax=Microseira wollei NIES-4236 TaxID=2530354 RepID=A0AAV3X9C8_9CYAN|nr:hypothetical protein MiSe_27100 [Microseira wollei NIES-4236]